MSYNFARFFLPVLIFLFVGSAANADELDDNEYIRVETSGKITNISVDGPELREQYEFLKRLQATPISDEAARQDLVARHDELTPPFLFELARRTFPIDKQEAVGWYFMGTIRSRLDAVLCTDTTAPQGIMFLPQMASEVGRFINEDPVEAGKIGKRVLADPDLMKGTASPWWICSHGRQAIRKAVQGQNPKELAWLKPEEEWEGLFKSILEGADTYFESLQAPMDDPVPTYERILEPRFITGDGKYKYFSWVDNGRLAFYEEVNRMGSNYLYLWEEGQSLTKVTDSVRAQTFCAGDGNIFFGTEWEVITPGPGGTFKEHFVLGPPENLKEFTETYSGIPIRPLRPGLFVRSGEADWRQNPFNCKMETSGKLNELFGDARYWVGLPNGRGYLASGEGNPDLESGLYYLPGEKSDPVRIWEANQDFSCLSYLAFSNAVSLQNTCPTYFVSSSGRGPDPERLFTVLLRFDDNIPVIEKRPFDLLPQERGETQLLFTKRGLVRLMKTRHTPVGEREGGFYWYVPGAGPVKIWEGYPDYAEVSPDGCQIAFNIVTRPNEGFASMEYRKIAVVDVCEALPEAN